MYLSDISGAFDRVDADRLCCVLQAPGFHKVMLDVLRSWLADRTSVVSVDGQLSEPHTLSNSVCQVTVEGPPLWNCFFESARMSVNERGYKEKVFADNLNAYKVFDQTIYAGLPTIIAQVGRS